MYPALASGYFQELQTLWHAAVQPSSAGEHYSPQTATASNKPQPKIIWLHLNEKEKNP